MDGKETVRHGRWITPVPGDGDTYCSECKRTPLHYLSILDYALTNYCPNCGAKMDGKENEGGTNGNDL